MFCLHLVASGNNNQSDETLQEDVFWEDFDVNSLKAEQLDIDKSLNFLLKYNGSKKKVGRPAKSDSTGKNSKTTLQVPESVSDDLKTFTDIKFLHPGVLLDHLKKINNFNKKVLNSLDCLKAKYDTLIDKVESRETTSTVLQSHDTHETPNVSLAPDHAENVIGPTSSSSNSNHDLILKIDTLEQKSYGDILFCSGDEVEKILSQDNFDNLEGKLKNKLRDVNFDVNDEHIRKVVPFGKNRKRLKVYCSSVSSKNKIINEFRKRKPEKIFCSEFLTSYRNNLFFKLRSLKRKYPSKLAAVYTRNGTVFYKLLHNNEYKCIRNLDDITALDQQLSVD